MNKSIQWLGAAAVLILAACSDETARVVQADARCQPTSVERSTNAVRRVDLETVPPAAHVTRDTAITAAIHADLLEFLSLAALKIDVNTIDGMVTLQGAVPDRDAARRAAHIARSVEGVRDVRNYVVPRRG